MKKLLCAMVILLSVCIYPIFLRVPEEITHVFGLIEIDTFSWYRMWLLTGVGSFFLLFIKERPPKTLMAYWATLLISTIASKYYRTSLFGAPWTHEGLLAITGYFGIYQASKKYGLFKELEKALDIVIFISFFACTLQIIYGNLMYFPPIHWLVPDMKYQIMRWPLYATLGSSNHLGLFCALFTPYALTRKKYPQVGMLLFMVVLCQSRAAWASIAITSLIIGKRTALYVALASVVIALPFHSQIIGKIRSSDLNLSGRTQLWRGSLPQLKNTPIIGSGPGNFAMSFPQRQLFGKYTVDRPHNMYLNTWISTGLLSLLVLATGIGFILLMTADQSLRLGAIGFLIAGFFTDSVLCVTPYFIIFLGAMAHKRDELLIYNH